MKNSLLINNYNFFSVIDTGGVFRNVTEIFWKNIKTKELIGGKLFDGTQLYLILQNSDIIEWAYSHTIGKLLFWSWLHIGSWPKWLNPLHLWYIIEGEESVTCLNALYEHIPYLYSLANDIKNLGLNDSRRRDIEYWISHNGLNVRYINEIYTLQNILFIFNKFLFTSFLFIFISMMKYYHIIIMI